MRFQTLEQWLDWQQTLNPAEIDLGLARIRQVMQRAGLPDRFACPLIMVAGTNGKGSVVATIEAIASEAGLRVAGYTSPHLLRYNERIRFNRQPVNDRELCAAFERIDRARGDIALTYFEFGTLAAIDLFHRQPLDLVVMEIGLGGRLDAVNVMQPAVSVITGIALDHTDWLGDTREQIAREKAGVMRAGKTTVVGDVDPPATLLQHAQQIGAKCLLAGRDFTLEQQADGWSLLTDSQRFDALPPPALPGAHQTGNAAVAIMALAQCVAITAEEIRSGLPAVHLAGRLQQLNAQPEVIADVAHNPQAVAALVAHCHRQPVAGDTHVLLGLLADKPVEQVAECLAEVAQHWHLLDLQQHGRGLSAQQLRQRLEPVLPGVKLHTHASVEQACDAILASMTVDDRMLITGSFYVVADALPVFAASALTQRELTENH